MPLSAATLLNLVARVGLMVDVIVDAGVNLAPMVRPVMVIRASPADSVMLSVPLIKLLNTFFDVQAL